MNTKCWYRSKILWFNFAVALVWFTLEIFKIFPVEPQWVAFVTLVGNFMLRFKTVVGIE